MLYAQGYSSEGLAQTMILDRRASEAPGDGSRRHSGVKGRESAGRRGRGEVHRQERGAHIPRNSGSRRDGHLSENAIDLLKVLNRLTSVGLEIVQSKNKFASPTPLGYRDEFEYPCPPPTTGAHTLPSSR